MAIGALACAFPDAYPVADGHLLVVPIDHRADLFALPMDHQLEVWAIASRVVNDLRERLAPDGFNVGVNVGEAGGQTVGHAHVHVIPRWRDDVTDPRGGIRWVMPERAQYWPT